MRNNWLRTGYVMVSRALLMEMYAKQGEALTDEEAFVRVLVHVNYKSTVVCYCGVEVNCERGESVITYMGWAEILGWTRGHTRRFFERCIADGLIEQVPGNCPSHIRIPGYDAWTGSPAGKTMAEPAEAASRRKAESALEESLKRFITHYSEVTQLPAENSGHVRSLWKKLSTAERELAYRRVEDYYYGLNNTNFCYQAARYLEYRVFENEYLN
ncbi:MAG: hypothetical protein LUF01_15145 [Bacteroides sp.]|nr:hypothetical protein [Bacteroides sp.]